MADILLLTPPFTQLNTPYPATAYLKGFLNTKKIHSFQMDLGIEVTLALFSKDKIKSVFDLAGEEIETKSENAQRIFQLRKEYITKIEAVIKFLQGKQANFARIIASEHYLPQASRFDQMDDLHWAFGNMGIQDKAKHLATMFLEDLTDFIVECVDENFGLSRYAERLGMSANSFEPLYEALNRKPTFTDELTLEILERKLHIIKPKLVCISVPFPGNLYSAFRCAQYIKANQPQIKVAMGGGFANTELRSLKDIRVFEFYDYISLDDGELPLELIIESVFKKQNFEFLKRTYRQENNEVVYDNSSIRQDYKQANVGTPDYTDLLLDKYISVIEIANPMHSLWSDGRWNKLTMAHGCYWGKCTFCDVSLDYIKNYEPLTARILVARMEKIVEQTGESGFHFVDEAAPPALMRELALEILKRKLNLTWWTNIRFEKSFSYDLCRLLQKSGCIAVSGGLEVASDRLLEVIDKGVTVPQVARVTRNFTSSGIMVHAYLMYGYPTQTIQETVDSLEMVRQLFEAEVLQSGFWHQFALTAHSPIGLAPEAYGVVPAFEEITFANNDIQFIDETGIDHSLFSYGLKKSLINFMHGIGFDFDLRDWFDFEIPETTIEQDYIEQALNEEDNGIRPSAKLHYIGQEPILKTSENDHQDGNDYATLIFVDRASTGEITLDCKKVNWLQKTISAMCKDHTTTTLSEFQANYEANFHDFDEFWNSEEMDLLREMGLLIL